MKQDILSTAQGNFVLVPATKLRKSLHLLPAEPGVYIWLVKRGKQLLQMSSYFDTDDRSPVQLDDYTHLYTGSAYDLRFRVGQHVRNDRTENSSPRKSLLALEHMFYAVTEVYGDRYGDLKDGGLTDWIFDNVVFGYELSDDPVSRETALIYRMVSPFNIAHRRQHKYSKYLMAWRAIAFPSEWMKTIPLEHPGNLDMTSARHRRDLVSAVNVK